LRGTNNIFKGREIRSVCHHCHQASYSNIELKAGVINVKKNYCENEDGRLGFPCRSIIHNTGMLELDHIDGNHFNNIPENIMTLCKICHARKSQLRGDYKRPPSVIRHLGIPPRSIFLLEEKNII
jgi:5-methylcytosine-specific restriction endonuclease McrA